MTREREVLFALTHIYYIEKAGCGESSMPGAFCTSPIYDETSSLEGAKEKTGDSSDFGPAKVFVSKSILTRALDTNTRA